MHSIAQRNSSKFGTCLHDSWHMELTLIYPTNHDAEVFTEWKHEEQLCVENHAMYKYQTGTIVATQNSYTNKIVLQRREKVSACLKGISYMLAFVPHQYVTSNWRLSSTTSTTYSGQR